MPKGGTKSLQEVEEIAREYISRARAARDLPKASITIVEAELEDIAGQPVYNVSGYLRWDQKWGGIFGIGQSTAIFQQRFTMQIEAWTGNIVGKKLLEPERVE